MLEEERIDTTSHLTALLGGLGVQVLVNELRRVAKLNKLRTHLLRLPSELVTFHDNFALSIDILADLFTLHHVVPAFPEVAQPVASSVHEHTTQELALEIASLSPKAHVLER